MLCVVILQHFIAGFFRCFENIWGFMKLYVPFSVVCTCFKLSNIFILCKSIIFPFCFYMTFWIRVPVNQKPKFKFRSCWWSHFYWGQSSQKLMHHPIQHLLVQRQILLDIILLSSLFCVDFTQCSRVFIVHFEQLNGSCDLMFFSNDVYDSYVIFKIQAIH